MIHIPKAPQFGLWDSWGNSKYQFGDGGEAFIGASEGLGTCATLCWGAEGCISPASWSPKGLKGLCRSFLFFLYLTFECPVFAPKSPMRMAVFFDHLKVSAWKLSISSVEPGYWIFAGGVAGTVPNLGSSNNGWRFFIIGAVETCWDRHKATWIIVWLIFILWKFVGWIKPNSRQRKNLRLSQCRILSGQVKEDNALD